MPYTANLDGRRYRLDETRGEWVELSEPSFLVRPNPGERPWRAIADSPPTPPRRSITYADVIGLLAMVAVFAFCVGYYLGYRP